MPATDGKDHLAYELQLTNTLTQDVTLTSLAVVAGDQTLMTLSGDNLKYWTRIIGNPTPTTKLGPGQTALVWLDVALNRPATVPERTHARGSASPSPKPQPPLLPATMTETVGQVSVQTRKPVVDRATAGRPELVGRRQLLRYDRAPDGDEPAQR